jgi:hypothetical protein
VGHSDVVVGGNFLYNRPNEAMLVLQDDVLSQKYKSRGTSGQ